jgi:hypothetical protein
MLMSDTMQTRRLFIGLAAALALGGCFKVGRGLPADAPPYVKALPDAANIVSVDVAGMKSVTYQTGSSVDDDLAFYRNLASANQLPEGPVPSTTPGVAGQKSAAFGDPNSPNYMIVLARPRTPGSAVVLTYKLPAKAS